MPLEYLPYVIACLPAVGLLAWLVIACRLWLSRPWKFRANFIAQDPPEVEPLVSVIVPARNEEENIQNCLEDLLAQTYKNYEIIVVDDQSDDNTYQDARELAKNKNNLQVIEGEPAPAATWTGKNWAAWQGYLQAAGEYLLFVDADMRFDSSLLKATVARALGETDTLYSLLPDQKLGGWLNKLLLPLHGLAILAVFPLGLVNDPSSPVAIAVGGYLFFSRSLYERVGGHRAVRSKLAEDLALSTRVKEKGGAVKLELSDRVRTVPYSGGRATFYGLTKHLLAAPVNSLLVILVIQLFFFSTHLLPLLFLAIGFYTPALVAATVALYGFIHALMLAVYYHTSESIAWTLLSFPALILYSAVNWLAVYQTVIHGGPTWKDRTYK